MESVKERRGESELRQFISFTVAEEEYGLELLRVREVIRVREITWLPRAPSFIRGIINLRGDVIPIIDLRERFGLQAQDATAMTRVIVVQVEGQLLGMVVDSASQVVRIPAEQIEQAPLLLGRLSRELVTGVGKIDDRLVALLDVSAVLGVGEKRDLSRLRGKDSRMRAAR